MKKLLLFLILFSSVLVVNVGRADAVPDIRGEYSGSYTTVVSNCAESGTYNAILAMSISIQTGNTFSGSATGTFEPNAIEYIQLSGTISETGQIRGNTSHTFLGTGGEGTFTGQLSGDTLTIENTGHDTYGETCSYVRSMSAIRTTPIISTSKIFSADGKSGDYFGQDVAIFSDYAIMGAPGDDNYVGSAYIFKKINNSWIELFKLKASDGEEGDSFGDTVAISGDYAIVGTDVSNSGYAYVFERNGDNWEEVAKLEKNTNRGFGKCVAISGNYAIIGGDYENEAYFFERRDGVWAEVSKLISSDSVVGDDFGGSISISGNYAILGARWQNIYDRGSGCAYIFEKNGDNWNQVSKLTPSAGNSYAFFGMSVAIYGNYAIVGAPWETIDYVDQVGAAYIYEKNIHGWNEVTKLTPPSSFPSGEWFGQSVSIFDDYAVVGAPDSDSVYIYKRNNSNWLLVNSINQGYMRFGSSVHISGNNIIVGEPYGDGITYDSGAAYIYSLSINQSDTDPTDPNSHPLKAMPWIPLLLLND